MRLGPQMLALSSDRLGAWDHGNPTGGKVGWELGIMEVGGTGASLYWVCDEVEKKMSPSMQGCLGLGWGHSCNVKLSFLPSSVCHFLFLCSTQVLKP